MVFFCVGGWFVVRLDFLWGLVGLSYGEDVCVGLDFRGLKVKIDIWVGF